MNHEHFMQRCLELALNGLGRTYPNPLVGCVIVHKDKIIGEGWHQKAGAAHAEVEAVSSVANKTLLRDSTLYVNLEPCSHFGKTPPCANLIIEHGISRVVIGTRDPHVLVAGKGIEKLKTEGIDVIENVLADESRRINKRFFTFHEQRRPYIILKWAETADGFIAPESRQETAPVWLTNKSSRQIVHRWRTEEQSILVGTKTVIDDNPMLTARLWHGQNPVRLAIDKSGKVSKDSYIFDNQAKTVIFTTDDADYAGCEAVNISGEFIPSIMEELYRREIQSVIVEGGEKTIQHFIDAGIWDEARIFRSGRAFSSGTRSPQIQGSVVYKQMILDDELTILERR